MNSLIGFEFKKIVTRKSTYITSLVVIALMTALCLMNAYSQQWYDGNLNTVSGLDAAAAKKANAEALAGPVSNERITEEFRTYRNFYQSAGDLKDEYTDEGSQASHFTLYEAQHRSFLQTFIAPWMQGPENIGYTIWRIDPEGETDLYGKLDATLESRLDDNMNDTWIYSDAERAFWLEKQQEVARPIEYGYAGGWIGVIDSFSLLMFILIAVCMAITPVFSSEYREKTDAIILSTRNGKSKLLTAKAIAAFLFVSTLMAIGLTIVIGIPLLFYGADGGNLSVQLANITIPYNLTMTQAVTICAGVAFVVAWGLTAFMLYLSATWKSSLGVMLVGIALVVLPVLLSLMKHGISAHVSLFFPALALSFGNLFSLLLSYPLGSFVLDAQTAVFIAYAVVIAAFIPLAMRGFRRHQVS